MLCDSSERCLPVARCWSRWYTWVFFCCPIQGKKIPASITSKNRDELELLAFNLLKTLKQRDKKIAGTFLEAATVVAAVNVVTVQQHFSICYLALGVLMRALQGFWSIKYPAVGISCRIDSWETR